MTYVLRMEFLPVTNAASNEHWRTKTRRHARDRRTMSNAALLAGVPMKPFDPAAIMCTRHSSKEPDLHENLRHGFKHLIDYMQVEWGSGKNRKPGLGYIVTDDPRRVFVEYRWEKAPPGRGFITIAVGAPPPHGRDCR